MINNKIDLFLNYYCKSDLYVSLCSFRRDPMRTHKIFFVLLCTIMVHVPSEVLGADCGYRYHDQTVKSDELKIKNKKRKRKRKKNTQKLKKLALGVGSLLTATFGVWYSAEALQRYRANSTNAHDYPPPVSHTVDAKHTPQNVKPECNNPSTDQPLEEAKNFEEGEDRGEGLISPEEEKAEHERQNKLLSKITLCVQSGDYKALSTIVNNRLNKITLAQFDINDQHSLIAQVLDCRQALKVRRMHPKLTIKDALQNQVRITQLLLDVGFDGHWWENSRDNKENSICMAHYLVNKKMAQRTISAVLQQYNEFPEVLSDLVISYVAENPDPDGVQFPSMIAAEMLGYSLPEVLHYASLSDKRLDGKRLGWLLDNAYKGMGQPYLPTVYVDKSRVLTLDDFKKEIIIRSLLESNTLFSANNIKISWYGQHVRTTAKLREIVQQHGPGRRHFDITSVKNRS